MKKYFATKNIRRIAVAISALLMIAALAFSVNAIMDTDDILNIGLGPKNSTAARTEMDNLFLYMMNECLPIGSIYMTTDANLDTAPKMNAHFGGTWERWGQGRVPVGANADNLPNVITSGSPAGTMGTNGRTATVTSLSAGVTGSISLNAGYVRRTNNTNTGSVTLSGGSVSVTGTQALTSNTIYLRTSDIPPHTHTYNWATTWTGHPGGNGGGNRIGDLGSGNQTRTAFNQDRWQISLNNNGSGTTQATTGFTVPYTFNAANIPFTLTHPTVHYGHPEVDYLAQAVNAVSVTASGSGTLTWNDNTVQPYATVYMYRRTGLATLSTLPS